MRSRPHAFPQRLHETTLRAGGREPCSRDPVQASDRSDHEPRPAASSRGQPCGLRRLVGAHSEAADGAAHGFSVKLDKWPAHLAAALAIRGGQIRAAGDGAKDTAHANGWEPADTANIAVRGDRIVAVVVADHAETAGASK
jgi:hypothetical protein